MNIRLWKISIKSLLHNKKEVVYQFLITGLLAAIIAGSLFTGYSVRNSLRSSVAEKLGNTDILVTSGERYFNSSLAASISEATGKETVTLLETDGYCQNFSTNETALDIYIYGVDNDFFSFHGIDSISVLPGTVLINERLADLIEITEGEEIMIRFKDSDPLPENAPFAPSEEESTIRRIMETAMILSPEQLGNFSLGADQTEPANIFMNIDDIDNGPNQISSGIEFIHLSEPGNGGRQVNRMLISDQDGESSEYYHEMLASLLEPSDIGLSLRLSEKRGEPEIISNRIFIDEGIVNDITRAIPTSEPLISYMVNSFTIKGKSTPYSFATSLPENLSGMPLEGNNIVINRWLADDIEANLGDSIDITWYSTLSGSNLTEETDRFIVTGILENEDDLLDPSFMPEFPGITGSVSCSSWDAGVPILIDNIRDKDEDYWDRYRGTPKAIISFEKGQEMWANNFGNATAIRFPPDMDVTGINEILTGKISPDLAGFSITDIRNSNTYAANNGVDFSSLFLGLSMFIIFSCVILLSMALSLWFNSRKRWVFALHALGYNGSAIRGMLLEETMIVAAIASTIGALSGFLVNLFIVKALNSVWIGAVHTNTISPGFSVWPLLIGSVSTFAISVGVVWIRLKRFLSSIESGEKLVIGKFSRSKNGRVLLFFTIISVGVIISSMVFRTQATILSFLAGAFVFTTFILAIRQYYLRNKEIRTNYSGLFYSRHPSQIVAPAIFLAAGIFAVAITGANKLTTNDSMLLPSGGTGGYLLWGESAVPVSEDLNSREDRFELGLDSEELDDLHFTQMRRVSGDNASCLNINHVTSPAILGVPSSEFIERGSFSFASKLKDKRDENPWALLNNNPGENTIYGIADQTVLEWSFKMKVGDTLNYIAENGQKLDIVICAGLQSSVFQGHLLIGDINLEKWFPSVDGYSVFLLDGDPGKTGIYSSNFVNTLSWYGPSIEPAIDKLASFFSVTNTYLSVFMILGIFGMILGTAGLGFILVSNFNRRRKEFAIMNAFGYNSKTIRDLLIKDQLIMLVWGIVTGLASGITATLPSLRTGSEFPWPTLLLMGISMFIIGFSTLLIAVKYLQKNILIHELRRE